MKATSRWFFFSIFICFISTIVGCKEGQAGKAVREQTIDSLPSTPSINRAKEGRDMSIGSRRRRVPAELEPILQDGVIYREVRSAQLLGQTQQSGYLIAEEADSRTQLWLQQIYKIDYAEGKETDVQEIYFLKLELLPGGKEILIEDELSRQYIVDIETRTVKGP